MDRYEIVKFNVSVEHDRKSVTLSMKIRFRKLKFKVMESIMCSDHIKTR